MNDGSTNQASRTIADELPRLPSFARIICEPAPCQPISECIDHWCPPEPTGCSVVDFGEGRNLGRAAIDFAHRTGGPVFLLYVVMSMERKPAGDLERGFIAELMGPALTGRLPPILSDTVMEEISTDGVDIVEMRELEHLTRLAMLTGKDHPEAFQELVFRLLDWTCGRWIGAGIYSFVTAAHNGVLH